MYFNHLKGGETCEGCLHKKNNFPEPKLAIAYKRLRDYSPNGETPYVMYLNSVIFLWLYNKYRKVYYRFTHLKSDLGREVEHIKILHSGKMEFSIMILDEDFNSLFLSCTKG